MIFGLLLDVLGHFSIKSKTNDNATLSFVLIDATGAAVFVHFCCQKRRHDSSCFAMILRPKPSPRHHAHACRCRLDRAESQRCRPGCAGPFPDTQSLAAGRASRTSRSPPAPPSARSMRWSAGRSDGPAPGGSGWRLSAAAVTAKQAGRVEDEAALRDAVLLTRPGDFSIRRSRRSYARWPGAGWPTRPAEELLTEKSIAAVLDELGSRPR